MERDIDVYRVAFDASPQMLWLLTPDGRVSDVNPTALDALPGADSGAGLPFWETPWWTNESAPTIRTTVMVAQTGQHTPAIELRAPGATGWWEVSVSPLCADDGTLDYMLVEARDITTRRIALARLEQSEHQLLESQALARIGTWSWQIGDDAITWSDSLHTIFGLPKTDRPPTYDEYIARIHPDDLETLRAAIRSAYTEHTTYTTHHRVVRPDGTERIVRGVGNVEADASGTVTRLYGVIQDVTERTSLEIQLADTVRRLNALTDMAQGMTAGFDRDEIYRQVAITLRPMIGAEALFVMQRDEDELVMTAVDQDGVGPLEQTRVPIATSSSGQVVLTGKSQLLRGDEALRRNEKGYVARNNFAPQAVMSVPMWWQDKIVGVITASHRDPTAFTLDDVKLLETAASWLALGLLNVDLWETQQRATRVADSRRRRMNSLTHRIVLAQEQERKRLARELHDESGQSLTALKISLDILQSMVDDPELREGIREAAALTGDTMDHIRHISHQLRPPALDTFGLEVTLEGLCVDMAQHYGIKIAYDGAELPPISEVTTIVVYRLVQEALSNVVRHAHATHATVKLYTRNNTFTIEINDNGTGFNTKSTVHGTGLSATAERLELLDASFAVESVPGEGTTVRASIPL